MSRILRRRPSPCDGRRLHRAVRGTGGHRHRPPGRARVKRDDISRAAVRSHAHQVAGDPIEAHQVARGDPLEDRQAGGQLRARSARTRSPGPTSSSPRWGRSRRHELHATHVNGERAHRGEDGVRGSRVGPAATTVLSLNGLDAYRDVCAGPGAERRCEHQRRWRARSTPVATTPPPDRQSLQRGRQPSTPATRSTSCARGITGRKRRRGHAHLCALGRRGRDGDLPGRGGPAREPVHLRRHRDGLEPHLSERAAQGRPLRLPSLQIFVQAGGDSSNFNFGTTGQGVPPQNTPFFCCGLRLLAWQGNAVDVWKEPNAPSVEAPPLARDDRGDARPVRLDGWDRICSHQAPEAERRPCAAAQECSSR